MKSPKTLQEAIVYFADSEQAFAYAVQLRWPEGVRCPRCDSDQHSFISTRRIWFCKGCQRQFTVKVGTVMEDSAVAVNRWMVAFWILANSRNGVSSCELARTLGVTQKSAWFMLHRIRLAMQPEGGGKLGGRVEVDETFIGGKARNMHAAKRRALAELPGGERKTIVPGMLERGGNVRAHVVPNREANTLQPIVLANVRHGAKVMSDEHAGYNGWKIPSCPAWSTTPLNT
ncbi:MAG TPA: IS1595 family transposase [Terriglobales bacterium]|nr:IS1595 family transposase [Terriglobales bacterium]